MAFEDVMPDIHFFAERVGIVAQAPVAKGSIETIGAKRIKPKRDARMRMGHQGVTCGAVASDIGPPTGAPLRLRVMAGGKQSRYEDQPDFFCLSHGYFIVMKIW
jgi:hypothetical protein